MEVRHYTTVASNDYSQVDTDIANGKKFQITKLGGNAAYNNEVKVEIKFGNDVLFSTHGDDSQDVLITGTGDGTKKVSIILTNDSSSSETFGGYFRIDLL